MPFLYEFIIDNQKVDVEMGFSTSRKWEEALDEAKLVIPFSYLNDTPYKMFSMLNIEIIEIASYTDRTPISTKTYEFIIYSDRPESVGHYGYYRHNVSAIEYTAKLDTYIIRQLAKSRSIIRNVQAPFITNDIINKGNTADRYIINATLEPLQINETIRANNEVVFPQVDLSYIRTTTSPTYYRRGNAVIRTNAPLISGTSPHTLTSGEATWVFPKGKWYIEYGYNGAISDEVGIVGFNTVYTFYVEAIDENELSMWDVVNEIRDCISKYGGIEDTIYYDTTRIFDIDPTYEDLLKNTQAPQIYMANATARQMLIYTLSFVNALPRLYRGEELDILSLEQYNLNTGSFSIQDVVGFSSQQNTNQIGTRNYQSISQALANDLDDPSITSPSSTGYQQVRSLDIQLTADNFALKLPERSPLYMPIKLSVLIPSVKIVNVLTLDVVYEATNFELDLTPRWINGEEWKLKLVTEDFPNITTTNVWDERLGLRENKVDNLQWNVGDTEIKLATIFGSIFQNNLVRNVYKEALYEHFVVNPPTPYIDTEMYVLYEIQYTMPSTTQYRDWRFRVEYITDERLVIKQDKEDISHVSFYSEMRQNQEESLVNIVRQSKKGYGDLQRTGNPTFSFAKKHISLDEFYEVGMKDSDGYTITQVDTQWFNDYAMATYHVTRYHNRIQQATFVNQKYRPFDNFAKNVLDRHEYYGDYLIATPPGESIAGVEEQATKIYSKDQTVRRIVEILLGLGGKPLPVKPKATVALIRTDGMLNEMVETGTIRRFISVPVTARGIKGGFTFTFGFQGNQVAGDKLTSKTKSGVTTYYNEAVRYTDSKGRFTRIGFAILKDMVYGVDDILTYPLVENNDYEFDSYFYNNVYFWCGVYDLNIPYQNPLVWNKDPMTNVGLTYGLNVLSYYVGLYVFGISFFTENYIVKNHDVLNGAVLYLYDDGTRYELFDDLFVKSGYARATTLRYDIAYGNINIEYDDTDNMVSFIGIDVENYTSWAIGLPKDDGTISLLVACNENLNGIQFANMHIRPGIYEIGANNYFNGNVTLDFDDKITLSSTIDYTEFIFPILSFDDTLTIGSTIIEYKSTDYVVTFADTLSMSSNIVATKSVDFVLDFNDLIALGSTIDVYPSTDYVVDFSDTITVSSTISSWIPTRHTTSFADTITLSSSIILDMPTWTYIGTSGTYDLDLTYMASGSICATSTTIRNWLLANYQPQNYGIGTVARVFRTNEDFNLCSPAYYYFEVTQ